MGLAPGDVVSGLLGWQRYAVIEASNGRDALERCERRDHLRRVADDPGSACRRCGALERGLQLAVFRLERRGALFNEAADDHGIELAGMTMTQFKNLETVAGSQVRLLTYRSGR